MRLNSAVYWEALLAVMGFSSIITAARAIDAVRGIVVLSTTTFEVDGRD